MSDLKASDLAAEYLDIQGAIEALNARAAQVKLSLAELLPRGDVKEWRVGGAVVEWVKGRRSEKVDQKVLRTALVLSGVTEQILGPAFAKATTVSEGEPHMRISREQATPATPA